MIAFKGYTHITLSVALFWSLKRILPLRDSNLLLMIFFTILGSITADIDSPNSLLGRWTFPISVVMKHRGFTHTIPGALLFALPIWIYSKIYFMTFLISYIFHLVVDTLTPAGVLWLYPFKNKRYTLNLIKTGSPEEGLICLIALIYIFSI